MSRDVDVLSEEKGGVGRNSQLERRRLLSECLEYKRLWTSRVNMK
jgi:hypothetical protein